jgi:hypothetical protein
MFGSMQGARDLRQALKEKIPGKIDIGPVYSQDPAKRAAYRGDTAASGFKPVERELVFDIDLTDYDDVRNSSSGTGMSRKCWVLMHAAIQVSLDSVCQRSAHVLRSVQDHLFCSIWRGSSLLRGSWILRSISQILTTHGTRAQHMHVSQVLDEQCMLPSR